MDETRTLAIPARRSRRVGRPGPAAPAPLQRVVTDELGRSWTVHELHEGICLLFRCTVAGVRPEIVRVGSRLALLSDDELLQALPAARE